MIGNHTPDQSEGSSHPANDKQFSSLWRQLFGDSSIQVHFADVELNSRVYTLDGESGYKVEHKKVGRGRGLDQPANSSPFPKKARRGESHGRARLSKEAVIGIREWAAALIASNEVPPWTAKSKELAVSEGALRDIVARRTWTHI